MNPLMTGFAGNVIGGYLLGQQQREARREQAELEEKKLKAMLDAAKLKSADDERKVAEETRKSAARQKLIDLELQKHGIQPTAPAQGSTESPGSGLQFDESFGPKPQAESKKGLMDILEQSPLLSQLLKEETGTDYPAAAEAIRRQKEDTWRRQNDILNLMVRAGAGTYVDEMDPQTGSVRSTFRLTNPTAANAVLQGLNNPGGVTPPQPQMPQRPMNPPAGGLGATPPALGVPPMSGGGGGIKSVPKPETRHEIKDGVEYDFEVNPYNGMEVPGSRRIAKEKQPMAGEAAGRTGMLASSIESFDQLKALMMPGGNLRKDWKTIVGFGNTLGPVSGIFVPEANEYDAYLRNSLTAKLRLETGANMPASELKDLNTRFRPNFFDSEKLVKSKIDSIEKFLNGSIEMLDPNKRYSKDTVKIKADDNNTYAWTPGEKSAPSLPPAAARILKENVVTVFQNGQRWTLKNGQPQQVP